MIRGITGGPPKCLLSLAIFIEKFARERIGAMLAAQARGTPQKRWRAHFGVQVSATRCARAVLAAQARVMPLVHKVQRWRERHRTHLRSLEKYATNLLF